MSWFCIEPCHRATHTSLGTSIAILNPSHSHLFCSPLSSPQPPHPHPTPSMIIGCPSTQFSYPKAPHLLYTSYGPPRHWHLSHQGIPIGISKLTKISYGLCHMPLILGQQNLQTSLASPDWSHNPHCFSKNLAPSSFLYHDYSPLLLSR